MDWVHASSGSRRKSELRPTAPCASSVTGYPCIAARFSRTSRFQSKIALDFFMQWWPQWRAARRATGKSANMSWPLLMLHTVNCSIAWLVLLLAWIGHVLDAKSASFNFCGPSCLVALVTHVLRTTLETGSRCGKFAVWQSVTQASALQTYWTTSC